MEHCLVIAIKQVPLALLATLWGDSVVANLTSLAVAVADAKLGTTGFHFASVSTFYSKWKYFVTLFTVYCSLFSAYGVQSYKVLINVTLIWQSS